eukprot:GHVS01026139.1.p1 GENE.GHVS01026139.1~~GHVS01026139.1.p1  ORF type:complete len:703 (-),score=101.68 GHVS01026139.1:83-2149(-)
MFVSPIGRRHQIRLNKCFLQLVPSSTCCCLYSVTQNTSYYHTQSITTPYTPSTTCQANNNGYHLIYPFTTTTRQTSVPFGTIASLSTTSNEHITPQQECSLTTTDTSSQVVQEEEQETAVEYDSRSSSCGITSVEMVKAYLESHSCKPHVFVAQLQDMCSQICADPEVLRALSARFHSSADEFFPPQIIQILQLFSFMGYSDESLVAATVTRIDDLLTKPSPLRLALLLRLFRHLNIHHPLAVMPVLERLPDHYHNFSNELADMIASLAGLHQHNQLLLDALASQCLIHKDYLKSSLYRCYESLSLHGYAHDALDVHIHKTVQNSKALSVMSPHDKLRLLAAFIRYGTDGPAELCRNSLITDLDAQNSLRWNTSASLLHRITSLGLRDSDLLERLANDMEVNIRSQEFTQFYLTTRLLGLVTSDYDDIDLLMLATTSEELYARLSHLGASQLCDVVYVCAALIESIDRKKPTTTTTVGDNNNTSVDQNAIEKLLPLLDSTLMELSRCYRQLSCTYRTRLWDAVMYLEQTFQGNLSSHLSDASKKFVFIVRHLLPPLSHLPSSPSSLDFNSLDITKVGGGHCHLVGAGDSLDCTPRLYLGADSFYTEQQLLMPTTSSTAATTSSSSRSISKLMSDDITSCAVVRKLTDIKNEFVVQKVRLRLSGAQYAICQHPVDVYSVGPIPQTPTHR